MKKSTSDNIDMWFTSPKFGKVEARILLSEIPILVLKRFKTENKMKYMAKIKKSLDEMG